MSEVDRLLAIRHHTGDRDAWIEVVRALGETGDPAAVVPLLRELPSPDLAPHVVEALHKLGEGELADAGLAALDGYPERLLALHDERAFELLAAGLVYSPRTQSVCIKPLGSLHEARAAERLVNALDSLTGHGRQTLLETIVEQGDLAVAPALAALEGDRTDQVTGAAVVLGRLREGRAVDPLLELLHGDGPEEPRLEAARALGLIGDRRATVALCRALDRVKFGWEVVEEALDRLHDPAAVPELIRLLREQERHAIPLHVVSLLGRLGDGQAVEPLLTSYLGLNRSPWRRAVVAALGRLGEAPLATALDAALLGQPDDLLALRDPRAVPALQAVLPPQPRSTSYWRTQPERYQAVEKCFATLALSLLGEPVSIEPMVNHLKYGGQEEAMAALVRLGAPAVEPLIAVLQDPEAYPFQRESAAVALARIGAPAAAAIPALQQAVSDHRDERPALQPALRELTRAARRSAGAAAERQWWRR